MKPSDFKKQPFSSVLGKSEYETIARNIMVILARNGNEWRRLPLDEYIEERLKDGNYSPRELDFFAEVVGYTISADNALLFCKSWLN